MITLNILYKKLLSLLIAPEGIEIKKNIIMKKLIVILLIAPEGIEIY